MIISKADLEANLDQHKMMIIFTKVDGSTRVMHCTRNPAFIPNDDAAIIALKGWAVDTVVRVYDLEKKAMRSFLIDKVTLMSI